MISLASIETEGRLRALDPVWVSVLAEEFARDGQTDAIRVVARGNGFKLVKGARRIAAALQLGWSEIEARIEPEEALPDDAAVRLAEIKGHMLQGELTALDRAVTVSAWCDLYKAAHGAAKRGPKPKLEVIDGGSDEALAEFTVTMTVNWSDAAQAALQLGEKTLFRHLKVARKIDQGVRARIAFHRIASSQKELLALADETTWRQKAIADVLLADDPKTDTIAGAIAIIDHAPAVKPVAAHQRIYERFVRLQAPEKEAFFEMNADAIDAWLAKRAAKRGRAA
nr:ParB N-terminal domain-containing protein [Aurantimonas sp. 22II-16-19i]